MIHEVLPDRLMMYVNQAHNTNHAQMLLGKIKHSVSWFFRITLAKIRTMSWLFQHPCPTSGLFRTSGNPAYILYLFINYSSDNCQMIIIFIIISQLINLILITYFWHEHHVQVDKISRRKDTALRHSARKWSGLMLQPPRAPHGPRRYRKKSNNIVVTYNEMPFATAMWL